MSNIWVPKFKIVEPKDYLYSRTEMEGWYRLKVRRASDGVVTKDTGWFPNIITDVGLDAVGLDGNYLAQCRVGTGNTAPAVSDTGLVAQVGTTTSIQSNTGTAQPSAPYYGARTITYRFTAGTATGNLAEIGVGSTVTLFSRALILDGGGSPTTITVLASEFLDATYQLRFKPPLSDVTDTINISGTVYDRITRAGNVTNALYWGAHGQGGGSNSFNFNHYTGNIAAITTLPTGSGFFGVAQNIGTYSSGTYFRDYRASVGLTEAVGTTRVLMYRLSQSTGMGCMQTQFDNGGVGIVKTSAQVLTVTFRHIWARGTP